MDTEEDLRRKGDEDFKRPVPPTRRRPKMKKAPPPPCVVNRQSNGTIPITHDVIMVHQPGEDCAINELLEGTIDLEVVLPDSTRMKMTVERRMPMMDLLVQATTANKINPGGHIISISPNSNKDNLHYKPNTPIGSLDTNTIYIMSKSAIISDPPASKMLRSQSQPFEPTFRLQVNLPRKQLMVVRVSPKTTLAEIKKMVCTEKKLDGSQYHLVHPTQPNYLVDLNFTLSEYGCTEVSLLSNSNINASICNSTSDLIGYPMSIGEEKKKNLLSIFKRKSKSVNNMMIAGDAFKDTASSRGVSPTRSDICDTHSLRTKRQSTKKRAPPPPPTPVATTPPTPTIEKTDKTNSISILPPAVSTTATITTATTTTMSHSRHSSDSSGYHEASILSDSPDNLSPETSSGSGGVRSSDSVRQQDIPENSTTRHVSRPVSRDKPNFSTVAHSTMLILSTTKKKRAPPPPPTPQSSPDKENHVNSVLPKADTKSFIPSGEKSPTEPCSAKKPKPTSPIPIEKSKNMSSQESMSPESPVSANGKDEATFTNHQELQSQNESYSTASDQPNSSPLASPIDKSPEVENSDATATTNQCHTEEETGEIIHLLEKGVNITVDGDELITEFIPPPLEFATPKPPPEYASTNKEISQPISHTNANNFDDTTKVKSLPTPHPRLTIKNSSQPKKTCRRSLKFSDFSAEPKPSEQQEELNLPCHNIKTIENTIIEEEFEIEETDADESTEQIQTEDAVSAEELFSKIEKEFPSDNEESITTEEKEWDFNNIPEPPSPFRNSIDGAFKTEPTQSEKSVRHSKNLKDVDDDMTIVSKIELQEDINGVSETEEFNNSDLIDNDLPPLPDSEPPREKSYTVGSTSSDIPPPLPESLPPESLESALPISEPNEIELLDSGPANLDIYEDENLPQDFEISEHVINNSEVTEKKIDPENNCKVDGISKVNITNNKESASLSKTFIIPQPRYHRLENFKIGSYKKEVTDDNLPWNSVNDLPSDYLATEKIRSTKVTPVLAEPNKEMDRTPVSLITDNINSSKIAPVLDKPNKETNRTSVNHVISSSKTAPVLVEPNRETGKTSVNRITDNIRSSKIAPVLDEPDKETGKTSVNRITDNIRSSKIAPVLDEPDKETDRTSVNLTTENFSPSKIVPDKRKKETGRSSVARTTDNISSLKILPFLEDLHRVTRRRSLNLTRDDIGSTDTHSILDEPDRTSVNLTTDDISSTRIPSAPDELNRETERTSIKPNYSFTIIPYKSRRTSRENGKLELGPTKDDIEIKQTGQTTKMVNKSNQNSLPSVDENEAKPNQEQLHEEYQKLQNQFLAWQEQLMKNQTLLQEKHIVPEMKVPSISIQTLSKPEEKPMPAYRSQTLPRPNPSVNKEPVEKPSSSTVEYNSYPRVHTLKNVTITSWQNKSSVDTFSSGSVAEMKPKFQQYENVHSIPQTNGTHENKSSVLENAKPKVPRISATFDVKPSSKHEKKQSVESSKNSETVKEVSPATVLAQIRKEMKANAKHPTGINIINDDTISKEDDNSKPKLSIKSKPNITYSYFGANSDNKVSYSNKQPVQDKVSENRVKPVVIATIKMKPAHEKNNKTVPVRRTEPHSVSAKNGVPPPPPLPPPSLPLNVPTNNITTTRKTLPTNKLKVSRTESQSDPREELMIEIRKFGGRTALRKVPPNQAGWHLKVFGTLSSSSV